MIKKILSFMLMMCAASFLRTQYVVKPHRHLVMFSYCCALVSHLCLEAVEVVWDLHKKQLVQVPLD